MDIRLTDIRDFADNRYRRVDDRPYGGGPGMVMMPQPVTAAIRHVKDCAIACDLSIPSGKVTDSCEMSTTWQKKSI